jgi:hypothetical protein
MLKFRLLGYGTKVAYVALCDGRKFGLTENVKGGNTIFFTGNDWEGEDNEKNAFTW